MSSEPGFEPSDFVSFFAMLSARGDISDEERAAIIGAAGSTKALPAGADIVKQASRPSFSTLVVEGMTARHSTVEDGGRQITGLHIAGDFVDLHSFPLKLMDHSVTCITDCRVMTFPHANLQKITEQLPHLTRVLWLLTLLDGSIHRQWMVSKGRLTADEKMAHFFCEQFVRARIAGLAERERFPLPLTQAELGDALGLSIVHTNRTLQRIRRSGVFEWQERLAVVKDWQALSEMGQFDQTYLYLEKLRR